MFYSALWGVTRGYFREVMQLPLMVFTHAPSGRYAGRGNVRQTEVGVPDEGYRSTQGSKV